MLVRLASSASAKASHTICHHSVSFGFFTLIIPSGGYRVSTVGLYQHSHQFVQRWNVELRHRGGLLEPFPHGPARIEQFETNIVVLSPSLQKYEHAKTAAFYGIHLGEVKHNCSGVALQGNNFAQLEGRVALHNSAVALNDRC
jgi:hypothetical protein